MAVPKPFTMSVQGLEGTGKTSLLLSMPTPLVVVNFGDRNPDILLSRLPVEKQKEIVVYNLHPKTPEGWTYDEAVQGLRQLGTIIQESIGSCTSFAIDGASRWWRAMQVVYVEPKEQERLKKGLKSMGGLLYEEANLRFDGIMSWLRSRDVYVAVTHVLKQDWDDNGPIPNSFSPRQNNQVPFIVDVQVELSKRCAACRAPFCERPDHVGRVHVARLIKMATDTALEGLQIEDPTFDKIAALYYGD